MDAANPERGDASQQSAASVVRQLKQIAENPQPPANFGRKLMTGEPSPDAAQRWAKQAKEYAAAISDYMDDDDPYDRDRLIGDAKQFFGEHITVDVKKSMATAFDDLLRHQGLDVRPAPAPRPAPPPVRQRLTPEQARAQLAALPKPDPTDAEVKASGLRVFHSAGGNIVLDSSLDQKMVKLLQTNLPDVPDRVSTGEWD